MTVPTIADELGGQWHKIAALLLARSGEQRIPVEEFAAVDGMAVVVGHANEGRTLVLRLVSQAEADRLHAEFLRSARRSN